MIASRGAGRGHLSHGTADVGLRKLLVTCFSRTSGRVIVASLLILNVQVFVWILMQRGIVVYPESANKPGVRYERKTKPGSD